MEEAPFILCARLAVIVLVYLCTFTLQCEAQYCRCVCGDIRLMTSCKDYLSSNMNYGSGYYWIYPDSGDISKPIQVFCDQETDGGGWLRLYYKSGPATCHSYPGFKWTSDLVNSMGVYQGISQLAVSDSEQTVNSSGSWVLENAKWNRFVACDANKVCSQGALEAQYGFSGDDVIANLANCRTPTNSSWSQAYTGGYAFVAGRLATFGTWSRMHYGCNTWVNVGDNTTFRFGGGVHHSGEFVHTSCNDYYPNQRNSVTSKWNTDNVRVIWIR
ncbi:uncharacterized protein LOC106164894 [Lingula anatina]|uniref:Uncharacterized protein LOC106164894 n=1 Tax=Lingula anatina TaxID=7574 RepID=A0A1S3ILJ3_LINAN|nr:uncharacterized protein LOC106164894 [Lingula anatina]|eukprot:XP_013398389.1 uncharacterized protein LOC106164894 [Lingula anatina]